MSVSAIVMTVFLVAGLGVFAYLMAPRMRLLLRAAPEPRFDRWGARTASTLKFALGQWRMPRDPVAGLAHILIFGGFLVVSIATISHFVHAYAPDAHLPGALGQYYSLIKDIFEALVILGAVYAIWRRVAPTESRVGRSREGVFVLGMILTLMVTDYLVYGGKLVEAGASGLPFNPGGHVAALLLAPLGIKAAILIGEISFWVHCIAILVFLNFLPIGKHFHVITSFPNVFFRNLEPYGRVKKDALDDEEKMEEVLETMGLGTTADLTWTMVMNMYSCTECGRCNMYCPTMLTDKPLSHRQLNLDLKKALYADQEVLLSGDAEKISALDPLVGERIKPDTVWACTTCGSCEQECPLFIEQTPRIIEMRKKLVLNGEISSELQRSFEGLERNSNPWGLGYDKRDEWADGLDILRMSDLEGADKDNPPLLYWIGCAGSFDDRNKKITFAMVEILKAAGIKFAILGKEEGCSGDPARRSGNEYLFGMLAQQNIEKLNEYGVKKILTHCPHCLHTLATEYPQFGGNYDVVHHSVFIEQLLASGKLNLTGGEAKKVAWHDSCYLGRYHDIYDAPRKAMAAVPGLEIIEMPRNRSRGVCCGAGGGRFWMEENIGERINEHRAKEAVATSPDAVGSACPFCLTMMKDGVAALDKGEDIETLDLAEIVARALPKAEAPA